MTTEEFNEITEELAKEVVKEDGAFGEARFVLEELQRRMRNLDLRKSEKGAFGKYLPYDELWEAIEETLSDLHLSTATYIKKGKIVTEIYYYGKVLISSEFPLKADLEGQKVGATLTYARRYNLCGLLNIPIKDGDLDDKKVVEVLPKFEEDDYEKLKSWDNLYEKYPLSVQLIDSLRKRFTISSEWVKKIQTELYDLTLGE